MNSQKSATVGQFSQNATDIINSIAQSGEPLVVTDNGDPLVVVMNYDDWVRSEESKAMRDLVSERLAEVRDGNTIGFDEGMAKVEHLFETQANGR